ncbi:unnamed protein product [Rotaria magnacalcarata]|uniref:TNF receptor-associated factor n=2 Tax=Rotaria magnacalcarata TaxID=392030 RepID=A0A816KAR2_9BILA|nr:unnamed protein product [Rotaria magnacalcarata]
MRPLLAINTEINNWDIPMRKYCYSYPLYIYVTIFSEESVTKGFFTVSPLLHINFRIETIMASTIKPEVFQPNDPSNSSGNISEHLACGYIILNCENVSDKWKCIYCFLIIKEPIQLMECGHRACKGCHESRAALATDGIMICPVEECKQQYYKAQVMNDRAFKKELDILPVICRHKMDQNCTWTGPLRAYQEHLDQAHIHYPCDLCRQIFSSSQALEDHKSKTCPSLFQACPLAPYCCEEMIPKADFSAHLWSAKHQETIALFLIGKYEIPDTFEQDQSMESSSAASELEQRTYEKLSDLAEKVQKLNDDTVTLSRDFVKLNELSQITIQEINHYQTATNERNVFMSSLQPKQDSIQKDIERLKQNLEENQHVSTDGTLTWRVDRVAERMADAQSERQPSIYSPVFYSSATGYKMRVRLYLHGDGNARRTHMSLFFLLMKGDYDALLPWPFSYKVTFCLFDQTGNNRHIIDSFRPDVKSNSFQRPQTDANIASGIPKFFPLPMIQQDDNPYVRDDILFIKIIVDLHDTPKLILPFMLTLNPGLPYHVQQVLINQEKIKRDQQQNTLTMITATQPTPMNTCG